MRDQNKKCIILALNSGSIIEDLKQIRKLGLPFKCLVGSYEGTLEDSYLITYETMSNLRKIEILADKFSQESILILNEDRDTFLYYLDGTAYDDLGKFTEVSRAKAYENKNWSLDLSTGRYYITEGV